MEQNNTMKTFDELFNELAKDRRDFVQAIKKNKSHYFNNLINIYPDKAHFIYELLQNAEDMDATVVEFSLFKDELIFKHNGTKRDFNYNDIVAITSDGDNEEKQDDKTSIGKFGIGFKAVFAYTDTPEIHSGNLHFKIENMIVPSRENVKTLPTLDENNLKWTIFVFPFNKEEKTPEKAFNEIYNGLKELSYSSIIFLRHIKEIKFSVDNKEKGFIKLNELEKENYIEIKSSDSKHSFWLRFSENIEHVDEKDNNKKLSIGVAYKLNYSEKNKTYKLEDTEGKAFVYFPAANGNTGLRFLINAPFATTPARDSIKDCEINDKLLEKVASLVVASLGRIKELDLMNNSFLDVLPNCCDKINDMYKPIFEQIVQAFKENDYLPTQSGEYVNSQNALICSKKISEVFSQDFYKSVSGTSKKWIQNVSVESNAYKFLQFLNIESLETEKFVRLFVYSSNNCLKLKDYLENKTVNFDNEAKKDICSWFNKFYNLFIGEYKSLNDYEKRWLKNVLSEKEIILSERLKLFKPSELYIQLSNQNEDFIKENNIEIVNLSFITDNPFSNEIYNFFRFELDIKVFDDEAKTRWKIANEQYEEFDENKHFKDLISHWSTCISKNIDLKNEKIFVSYDGTNFSRARACDLAINEQLAKIYDKSVIWEGYEKKFPDYFLENRNEAFILELMENLRNNNQYKGIVSILDNPSEYNIKNDDVPKYIYTIFYIFLFNCGITHDLTIETKSARQHALFYEKLENSRAKHNGKGIDVDYTISNIEKVLKQYNKLLWDFLKKQNNIEYSKARYSPNGSTKEKECDSTLIYELKNNAWIPDKNGILHRPSDICLFEISDDFECSDIEKRPLLKALDFKENPADKEELAKRNAYEYVEKTGQKIIPIEEYEKYIEYKELEARKKENKKQSSYTDIQTIFNNETRESKVLDDVEPVSEGEVNNLKRREEKYKVNFNNLKNMKPEYRKAFSFVVKSSREEHNTLKEYYKGECQICGKKITSHDGKPYFESINIIPDLPQNLSNTEKLCWNSLCLCPNCAAEYKHCSIDICNVPKQIEEKKVIENDPSKIEIEIVLDNKKRAVKFIPKHFSDLKTGFELFENSLNNLNAK